MTEQEEIEALDRTSKAYEAFCEKVESLDVIKRSPSLKAKADAIHAALFDLYQSVGQETRDA